MNDGPETNQRPQAAAKPKRPFAFTLHSLVGLKFSLFLGFVCLTGSIAVVSHEIEWLFQPEVRSSTITQKTDWGGVVDAALQEYPDARFREVRYFDYNEGAYFVRTVTLKLITGDEIDVYVDPVTLNVTGESRGVTFHAFMRALHYYLFAPGPIPFYLVTSLSFVLVGLAVTGLITYKRFWRGFLRWPRWRQSKRVLMGDLHRLTGLWSLWFVLLIASTGIWYFAEQIGVDFETPPPTLQEKEKAVLVEPDGDMVRLWAEQARQTMPALKITAINAPYAQGDVASVQGQWKAWLVRERTNMVYINPVANEVAGTRLAHRLGPGERIVHTADPLHFGNFGGLVSKIIWFVFGLFLTGMAFTGAYIYSARLKQSVTDSRILSPLNYLGIWKWPSVCLITVVPIVSFFFW